MQGKVVKSEKLSNPFEPRYVVVDDEGNVLDDAQGFGYTSAEKAHRAWGWKTNKKQRSKDKGIAKWWRKHKEFAAEVGELYLLNAKELVREEVSESDIFKAAEEIAKEKGIEGFNKDVFKVKGQGKCP